MKNYLHIKSEGCHEKPISFGGEKKLRLLIY